MASQHRRPEHPRLEDVVAARQRIAELVPATPVLLSPALSEAVGRPVWLKLESLQVTGSFKARGAANRMLSLDAESRRRGVVACSSGNHGLAVAWVAARLGLAATVCVPSWVDPAKLAAIREQGAEVRIAGDTYDEAEAATATLVREQGLTYVHPFDDPEVIAGQGTIGLELLEQLPDVGTIVVPLSGGGLLAGIAIAVKARRPEARVIGAAAARAAAMVAALGAGHPVEIDEEPTLATALSGGIGVPNRHSFEMVQKLMDDVHAADEPEIAAAMRFLFHRHRLVVEGGGAVGVAVVRRAAVQGDHLGAGSPLAIVVSGGNVAPCTLLGIVDSDSPGPR